MIFIQQGGMNRHEHICESLELFAAEVMPEFKSRGAEHERKKAEELAPYIEQAMSRKKWMKPLADDEIPEMVALGRSIVEQMKPAERTADFGRSGGLAVPLRDPAEE